ncbi:hypothetical protein EWM64_g616 [Hericium alpestre]|uniref:Uncharacterized protein n=1 Tax=Hericium alpestre TaxID=135208 RepID=A0A4Z0AAP9_9AGAM|nr:hypothetical protein EWM64_g616 [Hericium alpestre]
MQFSPISPPPPTFPPSQMSHHSQSNPIDLTLDDDDDDGDEEEEDDTHERTPAEERLSKRRRVEDRPATSFLDPYNASPSFAPFQQASAGPASLFDAAQTLSTPRYQPSSSFQHPEGRPMLSAASSFSAAYPPANFVQQPYRPAFARISTPSHSSSHNNRSHEPSSYSTPAPLTPSSRNAVIDLTGSPSPPPQHLQQSQPHTPSALPPQANHANFPPDLPPKTPVCIGQLSVTALVLYPTDYLRGTHADALGVDVEWAPVRLQYERNPNRPGSEDTIHIRTPNTKTVSGESQPGDAFGVVEQKVASALGPMLGKGLIRLDAKVRRGMPNLPILPLEMLVFTPKGNISVVGNYLRQSCLYLDHPHLIAEGRLCSQPYYNPHNPPPGGFNRNGMGPNRMGYTGPGGSSQGKWTAQAVSGKSVEVQRSQVDDLFKSLRGGDELEETEPPPEVGTQLYPHQKKALTFLLEREREIVGQDGKSSSLWQERRDPLSGARSWYHVVTQKESFRQPVECKGAILADDMGLGKTITCLALIACTLSSARAFASDPLPDPGPPPRVSSEPILGAVHFAGAVWDMPDVAHISTSSRKGKGKEAKLQDQADAQYARACRIKTKSRATLIVCPLSTVANWEDQFREHWSGKVTILGGGGICLSQSSAQASSSSLSSMTTLQHSLEGDVVLDASSSSTSAQSKPDVAPLRVYVYHGNARRPDPAFLADCDVVITTYATLASEFSKQSRSTASAADDEDSDDSVGEGMGSAMTMKLGKPKKQVKRKKFFAAGGAEATSALQSVYWFRVVLDEAHSIKEISTVGCRASCDLMADRRLCLTGTPVQNKLDDVFALVKFLRLEPFDDKSVWTELIGTPVKYAQPLGVARLQTIMKCITLRRTKESKDHDGHRILSLPPRRDELRYLKFDPHEQALYDRFFNESKAEFHELSDKNEVLKNYVGILQKILRLRQICDHFELVKGKGLFGDQASQSGLTSYEDVVAQIAHEGITPARAAFIFDILKDASTSQCVDCGCELNPNVTDLDECPSNTEQEAPSVPKRGRKPKGTASRTSTRVNSPSGAVQPVLTRCQHLFCICCYRRSIHAGWPKCDPDLYRPCPICQTGLLPSDAAEVNLAVVPTDTCANAKRKPGKREKGAPGISLEDIHPSTKVKALLNDLVQFSKANPHSSNYDPSSLDIQLLDNDGNLVDSIVKTVVFSQWTSMLDKIEDALEAVGIRYDRLDGTMKRDERSRAMDALKYDPGCEVLLVSLKAGGVGLNLTAAQRVYLMDPYWNPAVENQAVDRIHRLGQTKPVTTVKLIIENSIEARLLEVQKKKTELANMTLGHSFTKAELMQRRLEELNQLFG